MLDIKIAGGQLIDGTCAAIVNNKGITSLQEMLGHRPSHDAQSNKAKGLSHEPPDGPKWKRRVLGNPRRELDGLRVRRYDEGQAEVAELADAPGSGPGSRTGSAGSSPVFGTLKGKDLGKPGSLPFFTRPPLFR